MRIRASIFCTVLVCGTFLVAGSWRLPLQAADDSDVFWSFRPVRPVDAPTVRDSGWARSPVDQFILAKLEEHQIVPAPMADRRTLIRRATFDLTGLPPTPAEIETFLADDSPDAFRALIERLLASPQYGERWGRHWLDIVRYADARDLIQLPPESDFREAWRYRDWVVNAFNRDLPYDQFVMQQVAGDLMQPSDKNRIDADALVATGMLAIADFVPGDVDKQQMIADYVNDQIDVVGRAFLGLTLACARCHDHKFDPTTTEDYYALAGIFFSTRLVPGPVKGNTPLVRAPLLAPAAIAAIEADQARDKARLAELTTTINTFGEREYQAFLKRKVEADTERYLLAAWEFTHPSEGQERPGAEEFAKSRGLEAVHLTRWVAYFDEAWPLPTLSALRMAADKPAAVIQARELAGLLSVTAAELRAQEAAHPALRMLAESELLRFRADDRRIALNETQHVTAIPNRSLTVADAGVVPDVSGPTIAKGTLSQRSPATLRFSGNELLQVPLSVPAVGSLVVVFRPDPAGGPGQRLVGWEDASVGQHGLGIMTDGAGSLQAILRRNGASGDVTVPAPNPAPSNPTFQIVSIVWGPGGVTVHRNGLSVGTNKGIEAVSSDPAITALRIGGPGSGASPRFHGDLAELRVYSLPLDDHARSVVEAELTTRWNSTAQDSQTNEPLKEFYQELISAQSPFRLEAADRDKALPDDYRQRLAALRTELEALQKKPPVDIPRAVVVQDGGPPDTPHAGFRDAHVYLRGNHAKPGKVVPRGIPKFLVGDRPIEIREGSGRKELARWLASPDNPLTARVMVNRIWQHHFGVGLVPTSANFGEMGESPSHPELLDFLAAQFVKSGWSVKAMHRLIMLSSTYQQSAAPNAVAIAVDPENRLLWRANRKKLESEALRDSLLSVAGRLETAAGGPGFQEVANPRRTLYLMSVRTGAKTAEFGSLFDAADCSGIVERRTQSIVAPQALFLMNDPFVTELAGQLSERLFHEVPDGNNTDRIQRLYEITVGRPATAAEVDIGLSLVADTAEADVWTGYCRVVLSTNEFLFVD